MMLLCILMTLFYTTQGKDVCNQNAILKEIDSFKLSQRVTKDVALDFEPYSGLIEQMKLNQPGFESIVTKYTDPETFKAEEPDVLIPFTNSENLIKITTTHKSFAVTCNTKGAVMVNMENDSEKKLLLEQMKVDKLTSIPLMLYDYNGRISTFGGKQILIPPDSATLTTLTETYPSLLSSGELSYPASKVTGDVTGYCKKTRNYWDNSDSNKKTFVNLMNRIVKEFPSFKTSLEKISTKFGKSSKNITGSISLFPPQPLV